MKIENKNNIHNYTKINNVCLQDSNLSLSARGLLVYLGSIKNEPNSEMENSQLSEKLNCSKNKINKKIRELVKNGYAKRRQQQENDGKMGRWVTEVSDTPEFINHDVNPS